MKISMIAAAFGAFVIAPPAFAQGDVSSMTCEQYLKAEASAPPTGDKTADDLDNKMKAYCTANPTATAAEAMQKATSN